MIAFGTCLRLNGTKTKHCLHVLPNVTHVYYITPWDAQFKMQIFLSTSPSVCVRALFCFFATNIRKLNVNNAIVFLIHLQNCICFEFLLHLNELVLHSTNLEMKVRAHVSFVFRFCFAIESEIENGK